MSGWGENLASIWTNNVPPSRPSSSEICVYTYFLRQIQSRTRRKIKLLVLGSTPELRDWGFEEGLDISVVDKSESYYKCISRELRHKNIEETLYVQSWEEMKFPTKFDIIIGDLAIGNVDPLRFDEFLVNVNNALSKEGLFLGKSMIWNENDPISDPNEIIKNYKNSIHIHPYTYINHQLGLYCLDKSTYTLDFSSMFCEIKKLYDSGEMDEDIYMYFRNIGWDTEMKFKFFAPSQKMLIEAVDKYMKFDRFIYTTDYYSSVFPIYVIKRR